MTRIISGLVWEYSERYTTVCTVLYCAARSQSLGHRVQHSAASATRDPYKSYMRDPCPRRVSTTSTFCFSTHSCSRARARPQFGRPITSTGTRPRPLDHFLRVKAQTMEPLHLLDQSIAAGCTSYGEMTANYHGFGRVRQLKKRGSSISGGEEDGAEFSNVSFHCSAIVLFSTPDLDWCIHSCVSECVEKNVDGMRVLVQLDALIVCSQPGLEMMYTYTIDRLCTALLLCIHCVRRSV